MAYYLVTAQPKSGRRADLLEHLRRDKYVSIRPFGRALTRSLKNARVRDDGVAVWEEEDYCTPPLAQERAAALDEFFDHLDVKAVPKGAGWEEIEHLPPLFPELARDVS